MENDVYLLRIIASNNLSFSFFLNQMYCKLYPYPPNII